MKVKNYGPLCSRKPVIQFMTQEIEAIGCHLLLSFQLLSFISRLPSEEDEGEAIFVAK